MTRTRIVLLVAALCLAGILVTRGHSESEEMYRVDAVFDTARGVLPGGRVKIAGASVGVIDDISLTRERKALVEMRVDRRFAPFRSDAHCSIRGEGLVGAAVVNCQPGSPAGGALRAGERGHPTLPLDRTSVPVNLTDFFEIWKAPVRDRLRLVLNELGMGLAGRGDDLNDLLLRANPTLLKARRALSIVVAQRRVLGASIADSNRAMTRLASDRGAVRRFVVEAARTSRLTAVHDSAIGEGIARLPPLLRRSRDALTELDALSRTARPVVGDLRASAPALDSLTSRIEPFSKLALPATKSLKPALAEGNATVRKVGPFVRGLQRFTRAADPATRLTADLQVSLRDTGTFESLLKLFYAGASSMSRYDAVSHLDPSHLIESGCSKYTYQHDPGCDFHYVKQSGSPTPAAKGRRPSASAKPGSTVTADEPPAATQAPPLGNLKPLLPQLPKTGIDAVDDVLGGLLGYLLG